MQVGVAQKCMRRAMSARVIYEAPRVRTGYIVAGVLVVASAARLLLWKQAREVHEQAIAATEEAVAEYEDVYRPGGAGVRVDWERVERHVHAVEAHLARSGQGDVRHTDPHSTLSPEAARAAQRRRDAIAAANASAAAARAHHGAAASAPAEFDEGAARFLNDGAPLVAPLRPFRKPGVETQAPAGTTQSGARGPARPAGARTGGVA